jgi:hypothetical protein
MWMKERQIEAPHWRFGDRPGERAYAQSAGT